MRKLQIHRWPMLWKSKNNFCLSKQPILTEKVQSFMNGTFAQINIEEVIDNQFTLSKQYVDRALVKILKDPNIILEDSVYKRLWHQMVFEENSDNRKFLLKKLGQYYGCEKNQMKFINLIKWNDRVERIKALRVVEHMQPLNCRFIPQFLKQIQPKLQSKLERILFMNSVTIFFPQRVENYEHMLEFAQALTAQDIGIIKQFLKTPQFEEMYPAKVVHAFLNYLVKYCQLYKQEEVSLLQKLLVNLRLPIFKETLILFFYECAQRILNEPVSQVYIYRTIKNLAYFQIKHQQIATEISQNLDKYQWVFESKYNPTLFIEFLKLNNIEISAKLKSKVLNHSYYYLTHLNQNEFEFQRNLGHKLKFVIKLARSFDKASQNGIIQSLLDVQKTFTFSKQSLKFMFITACMFERLDIAEKWMYDIESTLEKTDVSIILNVLYNMERLKIPHKKRKFKYDIYEMEITGTVNQNQINYLFYLLNKSRQNDHRKIQLMNRLEPIVEQMCKSNTLRIKTLYSVLKEYANNPTDNKFLYVQLESNIMAELSKRIPLEAKDITFLLENFKKVKHGSHKFYDFLIAIQKNPSQRKQLLRQYHSKEKKFEELREKQRIDKIRTLQKDDHFNSYKKQ